MFDATFIFLQTTLEEVQFLMYDSGKPLKPTANPKYKSKVPRLFRILIFSEPRLLLILANSELLITDCTFDLDNLFKQVITVSASRPDIGSVPLVYGFLPNKETETYEMFWQEVRRLVQAHTDTKDWDGPETFVSDFELGLMNSITNIFPKSQMRGCLFHRGECLFRHIQQEGLQTLYQQDESFQRKMHVLAAFAYLPEADIPQAYADLLLRDYFHLDGEDEYYDDDTCAKISKVS